jgi:hypothetical protein
MKSLLAFALTTLSVHSAELTPSSIQRFIAIDNVCAWPNLTLLPDGSINATIFGRPSHGQVAGAAECWNSPDGAFWSRRGTPAPNDPHTNRMNVAAGIARNGDLVVLCSGWSDLKEPEAPKQSAFRDLILAPWACRSSDGGRTWTQIKKFPNPDAGWTNYVPFGDIKIGEDGALHFSCYGAELKDKARFGMKSQSMRSWHFRSADDGRSWERTGVIHPKGNETTVLHLGGRRWMAAARYTQMDILFSDDDGATWSEPQPVTAKNEINGHLARLADGRILLSYGNRVKTPPQYGVLARFTSDEGKTWSQPIRIAHTKDGDCGYPSTVQRADGKLVTAWYSKASENHERYHMGVAIWEAPAK